MESQNQNLLDALRQAQEAMDRCEVFYGESSDDSCRNIYNRIKEMLAEQQEMVQAEIESHKNKGKWQE